MKRIILIMTLLFQVAILAGCATDGVTRQTRQPFQGETDGFRGIPWGIDLATRYGMKFSNVDRDNSAIRYYSRKGDDLKFGGVTMNNIYYGSMDGKFFYVGLTTTGVATYSELKEAVFRQFGQGYYFVDEKGRLSHQWLGPTTRMIVRYEPLSETARLEMWSDAILQAHGK